jgi:hypothetical protein
MLMMYKLAVLDVVVVVVVGKTAKVSLQTARPVWLPYLIKLF